MRPQHMKTDYITCKKGILTVRAGDRQITIHIPTGEQLMRVTITQPTPEGFTALHQETFAFGEWGFVANSPDGSLN